MKICVVGAGAIGGLLAVKFSLAGHEVSVIDRGAHLKAIQEDGLKLIWHDGSKHVAKDIKGYESCAEVGGPQDLVVLALKAHFLEAVAKDVDRLIGPDSMILTVQNGIPWWYFHNLKGPNEGKRLDSLDPTGVLTKHIDGDKIIGCVVYPAAGVTEPGVIKHVEGDRFPIGELDGSESERANRLKELFEEAGFRSRVLDDIRSEIWLKAWGNLSFNPISALTHETLEGIARFPETRKLAEEMMREAQAVGEALGATFRHTIEKRISGAESVGPHKTSMLQDVEAGRSLETEALIGAILELAKITGTPCPHIFAVYSCVKLLNKKMVVDGVGVATKQAAE